MIGPLMARSPQQLQLPASSVRLQILQVLKHAKHSVTRLPCAVQVLEEYGRYADSAVGRFGTLPKGGPAPGVRQVLKPLLALFHGDQGCKRWKQAIDKHARSGATASAAIQVSHLQLVCAGTYLSLPGNAEDSAGQYCLHLCICIREPGNAEDSAGQGCLHVCICIREEQLSTLMKRLACAHMRLRGRPEPPPQDFILTCGS